MTFPSHFFSFFSYLTFVGVNLLRNTYVWWKTISQCLCIMSQSTCTNICVEFWIQIKLLSTHLGWLLLHHLNSTNDINDVHISIGCPNSFWVCKITTVVPWRSWIMIEKSFFHNWYVFIQEWRMFSVPEFFTKLAILDIYLFCTQIFLFLSDWYIKYPNFNRVWLVGKRVFEKCFAGKVCAAGISVRPCKFIYRTPFDFDFACLDVNGFGIWTRIECDLEDTTWVCLRLRKRPSNDSDGNPLYWLVNQPPDTLLWLNAFEWSKYDALVLIDNTVIVATNWKLDNKLLVWNIIKTLRNDL